MSKARVTGSPALKLMVLLRAQLNDTEGVHVRSEILKVVSPVFDGILDSHALASAKGEAVRVITLECTPGELESFVECISTYASGRKGQLDELSILLKHSTIAMRCLNKYDASGILRVLDLMSECLVESSCSPLAPYKQTLSNYFDARLAILPDDTLADVIPEAVYRFLTTLMIAKLASVEELRPARFQPQSEYAMSQICALRRAILVETTLGTFPPRIMAEVLMRTMLCGMRF